MQLLQGVTSVSYFLVICLIHVRPHSVIYLFFFLVVTMSFKLLANQQQVIISKSQRKVNKKQNAAQREGRPIS